MDSWQGLVSAFLSVYNIIRHLITGVFAAAFIVRSRRSNTKPSFCFSGYYQSPLKMCIINFNPYLAAVWNCKWAHGTWKPFENRMRTMCVVSVRFSETSLTPRPSNEGPAYSSARGQGFDPMTTLPSIRFQLFLRVHSKTSTLTVTTSLTCSNLGCARPILCSPSVDTNNRVHSLVIECICGSGPCGSKSDLGTSLALAKLWLQTSFSCGTCFWVALKGKPSGRRRSPSRPLSIDR